MIKPLFDCHLHTEMSGDSNLHLHSAIRRASILGLSGLCPTEHFDPRPTDPQMTGYDHTAACRRQDEFRNRHPYMPLGLGIEISYRPESEEQIADYISNNLFDLVIGSVHDIGNLYIRDWLNQSKQVISSGLQLYAPYFDLLTSAARSGLFPVIGHLDYVKKYPPYPRSGDLFEAFRSQIAAALEAQIAHGGIIEINTSGLRHQCREPYPCRDILLLYRELGGTLVTIGSDAHAEQHMNESLRLGSELAESVGLRPVSWTDLTS